MKKYFVDDWQRVLLVGYSTWAFVCAVAAMVLPALLWNWFAIALNPSFLAWAVVGFCFLGILGRVLKQSFQGRGKRRFVVAVLAVLFVWQGYQANAMDTPNEGLTPVVTPVVAVVAPDGADDLFSEVAFDLISRWEGKRNYAYLDIVNVPTICFGHTRTVSQADVVNRRFMSDAECRQLLVEEIGEYREQFHRHLTAETIATRLPVYRDAAFTSLTINIGWGAVGRSTAVRRLNAGDIDGACEALTWFNKAGGRRVAGLVNRRGMEEVYCRRE